MLVSVTESGRFWDKVQGMEAWDMAETLPGISILLGCSGCSVASRLSPEGGSWGARQVHLMQDQLGPSLGHLGWSVQSSLKEQESGKRGELATVRDPNKAWSPRKLRGACVAPRLCGSELGVFPEFFQNKPPTNRGAGEGPARGQKLVQVWGAENIGLACLFLGEGREKHPKWSCHTLWAS